MNIENKMQEYTKFVGQVTEQMNILKDRSDEAGGLDLYYAFLAKRKELLRSVSDHFRKTGVRLIETDEVINVGSPDISWLVIPEPKSVRVVE